MLVDADATHHDDEPAARIVDRREIAIEQPAERFLHHIFGVLDVAEHPEREVDQIGPVRRPKIGELGRVTLSVGGIGPINHAKPPVRSARS